MSRFGFRKKIKSIFSSKKRTYEIYDITYCLPDGTKQVVSAEEQYTVLMASQALPSSIGTGRRAGGTCPDGKCGSCRIEVIEHSGLSPQKDFERAVLKDLAAGLPHEGRERDPGPPQTPNTRLACHARIIDNGAIIQVPAVVDYDSLRGDIHGT